LYIVIIISLLLIRKSWKWLKVRSHGAFRCGAARRRML